MNLLIKGNIKLMDKICEPMFLGFIKEAVMLYMRYLCDVHGCISTHMMISLRVELLETYAMASFSSSMGSVAFTMFWNMVRFLHTHNTISPSWWSSQIAIVALTIHKM